MSFGIDEGENGGVLVPHGAGKTTTVECIGGTVRQDEGSVRVLGFDPQTEPRRVRRRLGYQMQSSTLPADLRVSGTIRMFAAFYPAPIDVCAPLEIVGLSAASTTNDLATP